MREELFHEALAEDAVEGWFLEQRVSIPLPLNHHPPKGLATEDITKESSTRFR